MGEPRSGAPLSPSPGRVPGAGVPWSRGVSGGALRYVDSPFPADSGPRLKHRHVIAAPRSRAGAERVVSGASRHTH